MARIAGINIPQNKLVHIGLTYIYGIGDKFSNQICSSLEIPKAKRINEFAARGGGGKRPSVTAAIVPLRALRRSRTQAQASWP